jgi:hypothetical protein
MLLRIPHSPLKIKIFWTVCQEYLSLGHMAVYDTISIVRPMTAKITPTDLDIAG